MAHQQRVKHAAFASRAAQRNGGTAHIARRWASRRLAALFSGERRLHHAARHGWHGTKALRRKRTAQHGEKAAAAMLKSEDAVKSESAATAKTAKAAALRGVASVTAHRMCRTGLRRAHPHAVNVITAAAAAWRLQQQNVRLPDLHGGRGHLATSPRGHCAVGIRRTVWRAVRWAMRAQTARTLAAHALLSALIFSRGIM